MRIGIDLDGCLVDFVTGHVARIKEITGKVIPTPVTTWNYPTLGPNPITKEQDRAVWQSITKDPLFWAGLPALPLAYETLRLLGNLRHEGHDIYFITSRPGVEAKLQSENWLREQGYFNPTVLLSSDKGPLARGLKLDVFIDDKPENCEEVNDARTDPDETRHCRVFIVDALYNREFQSPFVERTSSVLEALNRVFAPQLMSEAA